MLTPGTSLCIEFRLCTWCMELPFSRSIASLPLKNTSLWIVLHLNISKYIMPLILITGTRAPILLLKFCRVAGVFIQRHFFNSLIGTENASGAFLGWKMVSGKEKIAPNVLNLRTQVTRSSLRPIYRYNSILLILSLNRKIDLNVAKFCANRKIPTK